MKTTMLFCSAAIASAAFALPRVDPGTVTMAQDASGRITIGYVLEDEPAVVTVDIQTNSADGAWVSIGDRNLRGFGGDVNKLVQPSASARAVTWQPLYHWGEADVSGGRLRACVTAWPTNNPPDVAVLSLAMPSNTMFYTSLDALPLDPTNNLYKTEYLVMRHCHAAGLRWNRGSPFNEYDRRNDVQGEDTFVCTISADYYIGIFELTEYQAQTQTGRPYYSDAAEGRKAQTYHSWEYYRGSNSTYDWPTRGHEVAPTSLIGKMRAFTGYELDLPTAAQWEFACRAGTTTAYSNGSDSETEVRKVAWTSENAAAAIHEVGLLPANPWGLYDVHGNASEWVLDYVSNYPCNYDCENGPDAPPRDHSWMNGTYRTIKGGGFRQSSSKARSGAISDWSRPDNTSDNPTQLGCRLCMPAEVRN